MIRVLDQMSLTYVTLFSLLFHLILLTCSTDEQMGHVCPTTFQCGAFGTLGYPFTTAFNPGCGICVINCTDTAPTICLSPKGPWYEIKNTLSNNRSFLVSDQLLEYVLNSDTCDAFEGKTISLPKSTAVIFTTLWNETFWKCKRNFNLSSKGSFLRIHDCHDYSLYHSNNSSEDGSRFVNCTNFQYPKFLIVELSDKCSQCVSEGGHCQESKSHNFQCINKRKEKKSQLILGLVAIASSLGVVVLIVSIIICAKRRRASKGFKILGNKTTTRNRNVEAFLKSYGSLSPNRYTYSEIKKMTNNFEVKLGEGGYGAVFKGELHDSRFVAVKCLKRLTGDGEEFVNEVVSIGRTNHVNIVSLLGFCFEGDKRALVYEFLPNGSLEKFIYDAASCQSLPSKTLYTILVGIAKGLDYLHRGCNARILHFDIKPHNILLDEEFCPKISDFGLARLYPAKDSLVSMSEARGTIGYIAPEVFCRNNFGGVSNKSDVYSYGMMILDLVCGRRNVVAEAQQGSEMYFPEWIYRQLDLEVHGIMNGEEKELKRKMILVGLWCIQSYPSSRPPMDKVIEMLEGSLESIQVPPMPHLSSIPNSVINSTFSTAY